MASRAAILRAARAVPGAAQRTPAPQGDGSPWIGQIPSYATQPGPSFAAGYGPFLPRPPETFTQGAFGPFSPILPVPIDQPPADLPRAQPRRWQPSVGYNLPVGEPGSEGYKLASFSTLRQLADSYSVLRTCLEIRKNEIRGLNWDIVLTKDAAKAYRGDRKAMRDFGERRAKAMKWFKKPDPNYFDFSSWLHASLDQVFTYDALSLYLCPKKGRGLGRGLLGSDLDCMWAIDGSSIRPLMGLHGEKPRPPAPAFQQFEFGVPRADLTLMVTGQDLEDSGLTADDLRCHLRGDQLMYLPYLERPDSPYGFSLVEQAIIPIMTGLQKQAYQLDFFRESTIPSVYISPGDNANMSPTQIRELQTALNAIAGDIAWNFKVICLPPGSKVMPQKQMEIVDQADAWIAGEVCMVCNITPIEVGIIPQVSAVASPFAAREMSQASRTLHERVSTKPTLNYLSAIMDTILQVICRQEDMRFIFSGMEETQDVAALTDVGVKQAQSGIRSIDEVRDELGLTPWGLPETSSPVIFTTMGPIPLGNAQDVTDDANAIPATGAHDAARAAVTGSRPPRALPAGNSGTGRMNGPVTQRQARRGGALAPAHAMAEGAPGRSGGRPVPKAAAAELEALGRHLRKGMDLSGWVPRHLPGHVMASIAEDLGKGLSADQAVKVASAFLPKATPQQSRQQQQQLARRYAPQIQAAFQQAISQASGLVAAWATGTLAVTAAVLAGMITELIRDALLVVLVALWKAAWKAGAKDAAEETGGSAAAAGQAALQAFLDTHGANWASLIAGARQGDLLRAILAALAAGDPQSVVSRIAEVLGFEQRAEQIAVSETTRAWSAAMLLVMKAAGVAYKTWITRNDGRVCARCMANQDAGAIPADALFPSGHLAPPGHPECRCRPGIGKPRQVIAGKAMRRSVGLNGQETWEEATGDFAAGQGGRGPVRHLADGTQIPGAVPGASAGGEPPRWDGSEPDPVVEHAPDAEDDGEYGSAGGTGARPGAYWPAPYMDGWWPSPAGHGTGQPGTSSPGGGGPRGRPPGPTGKAADATARFLKDAPKARPGAVHRQMLENYPPDSIAWIRRIRWAGPVEVPLDLIDFSSRDRWAAHKQQGKVDSFARQLAAHEKVNPVVAVIRPGHSHARIIDGHHRTLACKKLGWPVRAYVGYLDADNAKAAYETHLAQEHQGSDPANKSFTAGNTGAAGVTYGLTPFNLPGSGKLPQEAVNYRHSTVDEFCGNCSMIRTDDSGSNYCTLVQGPIEPQMVCDRWEPATAYVAGLAVRASDTGRVLMLQRAVTDDDPAGGLWEFPAGHREDSETLLDAALREWQEETGCDLPQGDLTGQWAASNGIYEGFVLTVPAEAGVPIFDGRDAWTNPDDPDGDQVEAIAWWNPDLIDGNPAVRRELIADFGRLRAALYRSD